MPAAAPATLQESLRQPYQRATWTGDHGLLRQLFAQTVIFNLPHAVEVSGDMARQVLQLGTITLADGKRLGIFEVELKSATTQIARNRVGLRELLRSSIDEATIHGALAFYYHPKIGEYRFSFIARQSRIEADGSATSNETHPKRYTYVLGPGELCRTPAERLGLLAAQAGSAALPDLIDAFSVEKLTREFYQQLQHWYFWALGHVRFPEDAPKDAEGRDSLSLIRLLTRLIFVWFLKEKGLVPANLFDAGALEKLLRDFSPAGAKAKNSVYYRAVLQNLFFATLNSESDQRGWAREGQNMMAHSLYRFRDDFASAATALDLFKDIPFLNGGLFECLDKDLGEGAKPRYVRIDGFSRREDSQPTVPDFLFFGPGQDADLSAFYEEKKPGKKSRPARVRGLISILHDFKFTIEENTPLDEDVALDPELLGRVFENLLAAYNPETQVTARKQTGSFYTPREIVDYMTGQALFYALRQKVKELPDLDIRLTAALAHDNAPNPFNSVETGKLIAALDDLKILDPACGSGAFPMGVLHRLVHLLGKLDPGNARWKKRQLDKVAEITDPEIREIFRHDVEEAFAKNELGYGRKLYLIENCLYGVDIQPIAAQITKLRFFISLVVEQRADPAAPNRGIRPLPNLETKIVAANTLLGIARPGQQMLRNLDIDTKEAELRHVRDDHFLARTPKKKAKCREDDARLRKEIAALLKEDGWDSDTAKKLSAWDPYDQNTHADFFDNEWMFGLTDGFDIVIGNPPYVSALEFVRIYGAEKRDQLTAQHKTAKGAYDVFVPFIEKGVCLCSDRGVLSYITPNKYLSAQYAVELRAWLLEHASLLNLLDVSPLNVFEEAAVYPVVSIFRRGVHDSSDVTVLTPRSRSMARFDTAEFKTTRVPIAWLRLLPENIWGFLLSPNLALAPRVIAATKPLSRLGEVNATTTAAEADQYGNFLSSVQSRGALKVVNTGTIERFISLWGVAPMTHQGSKLLTPWLSLNGASVNDRRAEMYRSPKIIFAKMAKECEAFLDAEGEFASLNTNCFYAPRDGVKLKVACGIFNSRMFMCLYDLFFGALRMSGGYYQFQAPQLRVIPMPRLTGRLALQVEELVDQILAAKRADARADTSAWEAEIDRHVYALYGLTPEEIKIVEGGSTNH